MIRVTLVHGTFAREAAWVLPESTLRTILTEALGTISFDVFTWDGRNRFSSRASAALELTSRLEADSSDQQSPHFLIGHSHGGTVCLLALKSETVRARVNGIVCLSTPFLQISKRETDFFMPGLEYGYYLLLELGAFVSGWLITAKHFEGFWSHAAAAGLFTTVLTLILGTPVMFLYKFVLPDWSDRLAEAATFPATDCPMLIVREPGDEAGMLMAAVKLAKWIPDKLVRLSEGFQLLMIARGLGYVFPKNGGDEFDVSIAIRAYPKIAFFNIVVMIFSVLAFVALAPLVALTNIPLLAFGPELLLANAFVDITSEAVPVGRHLVIQGEGLGEDAGLRHSQAYEDRSVLEGIASWIRELVGHEPQAS